MQPGKHSMIVKPTLDTKFHIDYDWWGRENNDLRSYMMTHLLPDMREKFENKDTFEQVDYIDPDSGEVFQLDELGLAIQEAAKRPDFINPQTSLVDSVFRVFLANGNIPRSPQELEQDTGRDARTILKTFGGLQVYRGIRPLPINE
ncbi:MAG: hypothetical protein L0154_00585 [Chloroflexi bacterium]|nr:hypothetical protein [Chloroflexota bacterium]